MSNQDFKDDLEKLNFDNMKNDEKFELTYPWHEEDISVLKAIFAKDAETIKQHSQSTLHARNIIKCLKNDPTHLEFFLENYGRDPGAGSYFYTNIKDNRTFDIYKKYIWPENISKSDVTPKQWEYIKEIEYIDEESAKEMEELDAIEKAEKINTGG